jgi:glycosyltransferase involved in cell wall biosynthesis
VPNRKKVCFFSHEDKESLQREQYSLQDIRIFNELGYEVTIATSLREIPSNCDLYFSWWAAGSILPLIKARVCGKPIIVVAGGNDSALCHDSLSGHPIGYLAAPFYKKLAARISLRFGTVVLPVSQYMLENVTALGARRTVMVPNSVDTNIFCSSAEKRLHVTTTFNLDERYVRVKRGEVFVRSVPLVLCKYPEQTFVIIGKKGNAYERLRSLASDLGVERSISFVGAIQNFEVAGWLQRSKVYVQISDTETFGVAIAEAMSTGTPVVVSRRGAIPELVESHGVFVDQNDPQSVAGGMVKLLEKTDDDRRSIGEATRTRIIERYSYEKRREAIRSIAKTVLAGSREFARVTSKGTAEPTN